MNATELFALQNNLHSVGVTFAYCGYITEQILTGVGDALKQKLQSEDADTKTIRSVFAVFVEQMQNIIRYSVDQLPPPKNASSGFTAAESRYGILTIDQVDGVYVVHSGNLVATTDVQRMRERLQDIQKKSPEQLKTEYKERLKAGPDEFSKGAGIGLIEIARRASKPIEFDFMQVDEEHSFFVLKATI